MKKGTLLYTNSLVCTIIIIGFFITAVISYKGNWDVFEKDVEQVSNLTMESISHQIDSNFTKPVNVSLTMANDSLLKAFLDEEENHLEDEDFIQTMREYLDAYRVKYGYDSVFLVSTQTNRYYHFNGIDRILERDDPEDEWYYAFLDAEEEYSLNIDNDEAAKNEITIFINAMISDTTGKNMGIVGVGFRVDTLQALLRNYEEKFGVRAYLVSPSGTIEASTNQTGYKAENLFADSHYAPLQGKILKNTEDRQAFWFGDQNEKGYLVSQYIPNLGWYLLIDHNTADLNRQLTIQLYGAFAVLAAVLLFVLLTITGIIRKYNRQVIQLTIAREQEHQAAFVRATEQLYEKIYELDITHNRAASEATEEYFESLGVPKGTPYEDVLRIIAENQIKEEFRQGYIETFSSEHVLKAYAQGKENLQYDFMITSDGVNYYWMRIYAHIFTWTEDNSVRMLVYRQNIDAEKRREQYMIDKMQKDSLTGLYNKAATQEQIRAMLEAFPGPFAFFILDIDNFKQFNDHYGHAIGDKVLYEFSQRLRTQFREGDIVGRIGGDEFVAFMPVLDREAAVKKARQLANALPHEMGTDLGICKIAASIGVAISPQAGESFELLYQHADIALYKAKEKGKNRFAFYEYGM